MAKRTVVVFALISFVVSAAWSKPSDLPTDPIVTPFGKPPKSPKPLGRLVSDGPMQMTRPANAVHFDSRVAALASEAGTIVREGGTRATILSDSFEGSWPGSWSLYGNPTWGTDTTRYHSSSHSVWCAKGGTAGVDPPSDYPNNCNSWMVYGPFDMSDISATYAITLWVWLDNLAGDYFRIGFSHDDATYSTYGVTGTNAAWRNIPDDWDWSGDGINGLLQSFAGDDSVWLAFIFQSSPGGTAEGTFVDDVQLTSTPGTLYSISGTVTLDGSPLAGVRIKATPTQRHAITDASGNYAIIDLLADTYTVEPKKAGYTFTPATRSVAVGPDATGQDFSATYVGGDGTVDYHAVICGVSDYPGTASDLDYCDDDADDIEAALLSGYNWDSGNIQKLLDTAATKSAIQSAISTMASAADADDVCLFTFSGHGTTGPDNDHDETDGVDEFICAHDANIRDDELSDWLYDLPTETYVIFLDTCYSGGNIKGSASIRGIGDTIPAADDGFAADLVGTVATRDLDDNQCGVVVTACDDDETCAESSYLENGVFTYYLVEGMAGPADSNINDWISGEECHAYTAPRATAYNSGQHAQLYDGHDGDLDFFHWTDTIAPYITSWAIAATHTGVGEVVTTTPDGYVEPRNCGVVALLVNFSEPLDPGTVGTDPIQIVGVNNGDVSGSVNTGSLGLEGDGSILRIPMSSALPDQDTYTVTIPATICDPSSNALTGDRDIVLSGLKGDANSNKTVDVGDMLAVRAWVGSTVDCSTARYDVNCNGTIDVGDLLAVRAHVGHAAP